MGLHGAQRVIHLDVVAVIRALLQLQRLEGQADDGVGVRPQCPVAERVVGVWAVGEARRGESGDLPFLGVEGKHAALCPGEQGRVNKANEDVLPCLSPRCRARRHCRLSLGGCLLQGAPLLINIHLQSEVPGKDSPGHPLPLNNGKACAAIWPTPNQLQAAHGGPPCTQSSSLQALPHPAREIATPKRPLRD